MDHETFLHTATRETLRAGVVDWVSIGEVYSLVATSAPSRGEDELKSATFETVKALLHNELAKVGNISHSGFQAWDGTPESHLERISALIQSGTDKDWGDEAWLCNTARGDAVAHEV
jgi:hypothetical protein